MVPPRRPKDTVSREYRRSFAGENLRQATWVIVDVEAAGTNGAVGSSRRM